MSATIDPFSGGPLVQYTFGRKGSSRRGLVKKAAGSSVGKASSRGSAGSRGSKGSKGSGGSGGSGGYVVIAEVTGDRMVRWWTSQVDEHDRVRLELEARIENLESLNASLVTQLQHAQSSLLAPPGPADAGGSATASAEVTEAKESRLQRELEEKDVTIARLVRELRQEAKAHADLKILMLQHVF